MDDNIEVGSVNGNWLCHRHSPHTYTYTYMLYLILTNNVQYANANDILFIKLLLSVSGKCVENGRPESFWQSARTIFTQRLNDRQPVFVRPEIVGLPIALRSIPWSTIPNTLVFPSTKTSHTVRNWLNQFCSLDNAIPFRACVCPTVFGATKTVCLF